VRKGSWLARYECRACGRQWGKGGAHRVCPGCGDSRTNTSSLPKLVRYGYDGLVRKMTVLPTKEKPQ